MQRSDIAEYGKSSADTAELLSNPKDLRRGIFKEYKKVGRKKPERELILLSIFFFCLKLSV